MKSSVKKLIASIGFLIVSFVLVIGASYAWFTLSVNPEAAGIAINIGGSHTIQIAPDIKVIQENQILHYPGEFEETLYISSNESYSYLKNLSGLLPVSTADGIHWFTVSDTAFESDRKLEDYKRDSTLAQANLTEESENKKGSYVYIDFWVVAPMENCKLRLSTGTDGKGSYLISLPELEDNDSETLQLSAERGEAANCARIGFLTNTSTIMNGSMEAYIQSEGYREQYTKLNGIYQEPGELGENYQESTFLIYEPNGNAHTRIGASYIQTSFGSKVVYTEDGQYQITQPIGYEDGKNVLKDISDRLIVQKENTWNQSANNSTLLNEIFKGYAIQNSQSGKSGEELLKEFYQNSLANQYAAYLTQGMFYENTSELYSFGASDLLENTTVVEDAVIVTLERNVPQRIRMFVWLEGQDVDCVREASMESFAVGLEFAGSTE